MTTTAATTGVSMRCPECGEGLRMTTDAIGRSVEKCDACGYKKILGKATPNGVAKLPTGEPRSAAKPATLPAPEYGKPCPHCGQKVRKKKPPVETRYCYQCGEPFEYVAGVVGRGNKLARYTCPKHRKMKS